MNKKILMGALVVCGAVAALGAYLYAKPAATDALREEGGIMVAHKCKAEYGGNAFYDFPVDHTCKPVRLDQNWVNAHFAPSMMVFVDKTSVKRDGDIITFRSRFYLGMPMDLSSGGQADEIEADYDYDCRQKQQTMTHGLFFLDGQKTYEQDARPSEPIQPETAADSLYGLLCLDKPADSGHEDHGH